MPSLPSDPTLLAGIAIGVGGTLAIAFAVVGALESRFVTRREYTATLKSIDLQLVDLKAAVERNGGN